MGRACGRQENRRSNGIGCHAERLWGCGRRRIGRRMIGWRVSDINALIAQRAVRMFPMLARVNVVRSWRAIRVMPADGFPIYDQSATHPGAFLVTCHSGVTLAAAHALMLAPMIAAGTLNGSRVGAFSARRFERQPSLSPAAAATRTSHVPTPS